MCCFDSRGINQLTSESLEEYLKQNLTVVAMWSNKDCLNCDLEVYTMYKMVYTFSDYDNIIFAASNCGVDEAFENKYQIAPRLETPQYRVFLRGYHIPVAKNVNIPTEEWIKELTGYSPKREAVFLLSDKSYPALKEKFNNRNILLLFCKPASVKCQNLIAGYLMAADIFKTTPNALFVYVDCSLHANLCGHFEIDVVPSFRFIAPGEQFAVDDNLISVHGENIIAYMNQKCGTRFLSDGHYDELYGRTRELDLIAHNFMNNEDEEYRKKLVKEVVDMVKTAPEAARYFNIMKSIMLSGNSAILTELTAIKHKIKSARPGSKESKALSARNNVIHQFEKVVLWKTLVTATPWNYDYLLNKNHLLLLITITECEECSESLEVFTALAKRGVRGVTIATMNCDKYSDFCYHFHLDSYPTIYFYYKNQDALKPTIVKETIRMSTLRDYVDDMLDEYYGGEL